jgi:hypothetical protein
MITISNKTTVDLVTLAGVGFVAIAGMGTVKDSGWFKLGYVALAGGSFLFSKELSRTSEEQDLGDEVYKERMRLLEEEEFQIDAENHLTAHKVMSEHRIMNQIAPGHTVDVAAQTVQPQALPVASAPVAAIPSAQAIAAPVPVHAQPQGIQPMQVQSVQQRPDIVLPDGAKLIEASDLENINKYPVMLVVAGMGSGKTETMRWVLSRMSGTKVFCSHKAERIDTQIFDQCYGYCPKTDESAWIGDQPSTIQEDQRDLTWIGQNYGGIGTVAEFIWGSYREIRNRQKCGPTRAKELPMYRCFFDEASVTYTSSFQSPMNPDNDKWGKALMSSCNALTFMDARSHRVQMIFASQSESVETIGLKNMSGPRDDAWHLYPGMEAIACAQKNKKAGLAKWLEDRLSQGFAIALLEKQGIFFHVLNLPQISELPNLPIRQQATAVQPTTQPTATIYDLVEQAKEDEEEA